MSWFSGSAHAGGYSCPYGYKNCDYKKSDCETCILNDVKNCGDCHNECQPKPYHTVKCEDKQCVYKKKCYADTKRDVNNCGECGNQCKVEWQGGVVKCYDGQCKQQCKTGYEYDRKTKCCVKKCYADTKTDVNNCGECGHQCKVEWQGGVVKCYDGQCKQQCKHGYEYNWKTKCCVEKH